MSYNIYNFKVENDKSMDLCEMDDIIQTSLSVNTSIDYINDSNNHRNKNRRKNYNEKKPENSKNKQKDILAVNFETTQEYTCTSLQMNTSLDVSNKLQNDNSTIDAFSVKDINSTKNNNFDNDDIIDDNDKTNNYEIQHQNTVIQKKIYDNERNSIVNNIIDPHSNSEMHTIIKESSDKYNVGIDQNIKQSIKFPKEKKSKRKLLPLHECSQLVSISPVQNEKCISPTCLIFKKNHKRKNNEPNDINNIKSINKNNNRDYNRKTQKKIKKIISKKIVVKKMINDDILQRLKENKENFNREKTRNIYSGERNSSDDFQLLKNSSIVHLMKKKTRENRLNIVATGLSNEDKDIVKSVVKILGLAKIESNVTKNTTHVVTTGIRTINLLHGIIRGCWLVTLEWVLKSLENNTWLNPEKYEIVHFSKAVLENRKDRQLFGKSYVPELFTACGYIYIQKNTTPPYNILKELIKAAGGCVTEHPETARILIGIGGLKETWILDCITSGELQPHDQYKQ